MVVASISIAGPRFRINRERMKKEILPAVVQTARSISAQLGYVERR
jgi:DNA-binding IclR family transcriptional regulator